MLIGNWLINIISACFAFMIVFIASFSHNLLKTTFIRATIAFVIVYLLAYLFRWFAYIAFHTEEESVEEIELESKLEVEEEVEQEVEQLELVDKKLDLTEEELLKTSQYVKDLLNDEEG